METGNETNFTVVFSNATVVIENLNSTLSAGDLKLQNFTYAVAKTELLGFKKKYIKNLNFLMKSKKIWAKNLTIFYSFLKLKLSLKKI